MYSKKSYCKSDLSGGIVKSVGGTQVVSYVFLLILAHIILASLMWGNVIQFAANDAKILTATALTVIAFVLMIYMVYLITASPHDA